MMTAQILLTPLEAADLIRLPTRQVVKLAKAGSLPCIRLPGDEYRFSEADLWRWVERHRHDEEGAGDE